MEEPLEIGFGKADITPAVGCTLSGFISRQGQPSLSVDDPLSVAVLAIREGGQNAFLVSYNLLLVGAELEEQILSGLGAGLGGQFSRQRCVLVTIHTHSGPPTSPLEGESEPDAGYNRLVVERTVQAAEMALAGLEPAALFYASTRLPGLTYNRRAVLADGRVSISLEPDAPVLERGPVDDTLTALAWRNPAGKALAVVLHFACHGVALCTPAISADIPGELARRAGLLFGAPCLYLQGATGDTNPMTVASTRGPMLDWADQAERFLKDLPGRLQPLRSSPLRIESLRLPLAYQPFPPRERVEEHIQGLRQIAAGKTDSPEVRAALLQFADLMNYKPGQMPDPQTSAFMADVLVHSEEGILQAIDLGEALPAPTLAINVWSLGQVALVFLAAEVFAVTGFKIRALGRGQAVLPVSYASATVGYLPDLAAMGKGGYEVSEAWRFYRHPAPFTADAEERVVEAVRGMLERIR